MVQIADFWHGQQHVWLRGPAILETGKDKRENRHLLAIDFVAQRLRVAHSGDAPSSCYPVTLRADGMCVFAGSWGTVNEKGFPIAR